MRKVLLLLTIALGGAGVAPAHADEQACLDTTAQHAAIRSGKAVPLASAVRSAQGKGSAGELLGARLCHGQKGLVYVLTLLARDGKVVRATVDAGNGQVLGGR